MGDGGWASVWPGQCEKAPKGEDLGWRLPSSSSHLSSGRGSLRRLFFGKGIWAVAAPVGWGGVTVVPCCVKGGAPSPSSANIASHPRVSLGQGALIVVRWQYRQRGAFSVRSQQLSAVHMCIKCGACPRRVGQLSVTLTRLLPLPCGISEALGSNGCYVSPWQTRGVCVHVCRFDLLHV